MKWTGHATLWTSDESVPPSGKSAHAIREHDRLFEPGEPLDGSRTQRECELVDAVSLPADAPFIARRLAAFLTEHPDPPGGGE